MKDDDPVFHRAMQWLSDLEDNRADSAALFRWLAESPRHVEEFAFALSFTDEIAGLTDEQCAEIAAMNAVQRQAQTIVPLTNVSRLRESPNAVDPLKPARSRKPLALAAAVLIAILGGAVFWWNDGWKTYATDFGEQRVVELADGSVIHLNTQSRVRVRYGEDSRDIQLRSGEVLFKVERDPAHPFRVYADQSIIQAVGTQFNVYRREAGTTVSVLEGSVQIMPNAQPLPSNSGHAGASPPVAVENLAVGEEAKIAPKGQIVTRRIDVTQTATWRLRRLVFRNDTLFDIAAEFNRYNRRPRIRIEDSHAGAKRFAATFDADAPESLMQVLETNPDLSIQRTDDEIVVRSR